MNSEEEIQIVDPGQSSGVGTIYWVNKPTSTLTQCFVLLMQADQLPELVPNTEESSSEEYLRYVGHIVQNLEQDKILYPISCTGKYSVQSDFRQETQETAKTMVYEEPSSMTSELKVLNSAARILYSNDQSVPEEILDSMDDYMLNFFPKKPTLPGRI